MRATRRQDAVFKALADRTRRRILDLLKDQSMTTGQICEGLAPLDRCTVMLHLRVLEQAELVIARREGRFRWNHLNSAPIQEIYSRWISHYARPSVARLTELKHSLEAEVESTRAALEPGRARNRASA
jgi:DNA-binding transcriptional ArsR family regulator